MYNRRGCRHRKDVDGTLFAVLCNGMGETLLLRCFGLTWKGTEAILGHLIWQSSYSHASCWKFRSFGWAHDVLGIKVHRICRLPLSVIIHSPGTSTAYKPLSSFHPPAEIQSPSIHLPLIHLAFSKLIIIVNLVGKSLMQGQLERKFWLGRQLEVDTLSY